MADIYKPCCKTEGAVVLDPVDSVMDELTLKGVILVRFLGLRGREGGREGASSEHRGILAIHTNT